MAESKFYIGYDNSGDKCNHKTEFFNADLANELEVDFIVHHIHPEGSVAEEADIAKIMAARFDKFGIEFVPNCETSNWREDFTGPDGFDWAGRPDGSHRFRFPKEVIKGYATSSMFAGVLYDEAEHAVINRNLSLAYKNSQADFPFFPDKPDYDIRQLGDFYKECSEELYDECTENGAVRVLGEHVFPVLFHSFAKAGIIPNYKQQKENWSNVFAACAMGAAKQYGTELWTCVDLWCGMIFPGHSPEEMESNLVFAYLIGVDRAYVEGCSRFYTLDDNNSVKLNEYGEAFKRFSTVYLKENRRDYTFRDFEPSIGIIRFDDGDWGQMDDFVWKDMLLGSKSLKTDEITHEWLRAWHTITHGQTKVESISWDRMEAYWDTPHRSFAPVNGPIVFDETVAEEQLKTLELCFLCGVYITPGTLAAVASLVKNNGLAVVTGKRFAPEYVLEKCAGDFSEIPDEKGRWIITNDMAGDNVKTAVASLLGEPDKMIYKFKGGKSLRLQISENGETFEVV